jgi:hypothetical protein
MPTHSEPIITRNTIHPWAQGRYTVRYAGWETWAMTLLGARYSARRLKRKADAHGRVMR